MPFELDVALSESGIIDGKPLLEAVRGLSKLVESTIRRFKPFLAGKPSPHSKKGRH